MREIKPFIAIRIASPGRVDHCCAMVNARSPFVLLLIFCCSLVLAPFSKAEESKIPADAEAAKMILGKWAFKGGTEEIKGDGTREFKADGTMSTKFTISIAGEKISGALETTWKIENGHLVWKVTKSTNTDLYKVGEDAREKLLVLTPTALKFSDVDNMVWDSTRPK